MRSLIAFGDWLTMNNILPLPPGIHWRLVAVLNRLSERF